MKQRTYIAIDLKSFYASVECRERGLDPMDTNLVVADESRTDKTICLAVTPSTNPTVSQDADACLKSSSESRKQTPEDGMTHRGEDLKESPISSRSCKQILNLRLTSS